MEPELFGRYRLDELIGRGGMGEVYRAFDTVTRRTVAIKRLPRHLAADAEFQARFRRESALDAAHAAGLAHRDVKPSNVLITDNHRFVYLADFGVARQLDGEQTALTATGITVGTLDYMAPERFTAG